MNTQILVFNEQQKDAVIAQAASILKNGGLAAFPTETVYGLGALYNNPDAVNKIYAVKGRPADNPLILHIAGIDALNLLAQDIPDTAYALAGAFWPGPMTLILYKSGSIPDIITRGLITIAVRLPGNPAARLLTEHAGILAAPSANTSGAPSPTSASHVIRDLSGKIDCIIDGGPCEVGLESTIIDLTAKTPAVLRPGGITLDMIKSVIGDCVYTNDDTPLKPKAPGMKYKHYAPKAKVTVVMGSPRAAAREINALIRQNPGIKAGILATDETLGYYKCSADILSLGSRRTPEVIARNLFKQLRAFDELQCGRIFAEGLPGGGIETAVMNRLTKAAGGDIIHTGDDHLRILFVCTGNTCRSPMARVIAQDVFSKAGLDITIDSAGVSAAPGDAASVNAVKAAENNGLDLKDHKSKQINTTNLAEYDIILTMTRAHKAYIEELTEKDDLPVFTICEYAEESGDITDPFGGDLDTYERCFSDLKQKIGKIAKKLQKEQPI